MGDPYYLILFVVDFSDMSAIKGTLKQKIEHKLVIDSQIDKNSTGVKLTFLSTKSLQDHNYLDVQGMTIFFENPQKAKEAKDWIEYNRRKLI